MELLSEIWDKTTDAFTAVTEGVSEGLVRLFGNSNERRSATCGRRSPDQRARAGDAGPFGGRAAGQDGRIPAARAAGETLEDLLPEAFAAAASRAAGISRCGISTSS